MDRKAKKTDLKILFLDIDGVLNGIETFERQHRRWEAAAAQGHEPVVVMQDMIDPLMLGRILDVIKRTGCKVVISSTWRGWLDTPPDDKILENIGLAPFIHEDWRTGFDPKRFRGNEIAEWLSNHPEVSTFAIVDDDTDMLDSQRPFFVKTDCETGIQPEEVEKLVDILGQI